MEDRESVFIILQTRIGFKGRSDVISSVLSGPKLEEEGGATGDEYQEPGQGQRPSGQPAGPGILLRFRRK